MAKKEKKSFYFSLSHLIRLALFLIIFFYLINLFSQKNQSLIDPTTFDGEKNQTLLQDFVTYLYSFIPDSTKQKITHIPDTPAVKGVSQQFSGLINQIVSLPKKIINDIKVQVAASIYQSIISQ